MEGIHFALTFLEKWQKIQMGNDNEYLNAKGKDVVVIGGGDTGCDCIGTSLRMVSRVDAGLGFYLSQFYFRISMRISQITKNHTRHGK